MSRSDGRRNMATNPPGLDGDHPCADSRSRWHRAAIRGAGPAGVRGDACDRRGFAPVRVLVRFGTGSYVILESYAECRHFVAHQRSDHHRRMAAGFRELIDEMTLEWIDLVSGGGPDRQSGSPAPAAGDDERARGGARPAGQRTSRVVGRLGVSDRGAEGQRPTATDHWVAERTEKRDAGHA
jgi:hypothetical protein